MDKPPQIAEKQLVRTMDKAQEKSFTDKKKVNASVFYVNMSKSEKISRWRLIDKALHCDCSHQKDPCSFQQWVQQEAKRSTL